MNHPCNEAFGLLTSRVQLLARGRNSSNASNSDGSGGIAATYARLPSSSSSTSPMLNAAEGEEMYIGAALDGDLDRRVLSQLPGMAPG